MARLVLIAFALLGGALAGLVAGLLAIVAIRGLVADDMAAGVALLLTLGGAAVGEELARARLPRQPARRA